MARSHSAVAEAAAPAMVAEPPASRLRNPAEIAQILTRIHDQRGLITIHVEGSAGSYASMLLSVDFTSGALLLDELHPREGDRNVGSGVRLLVSARLDGSRIEFSCMVRASVDYRGAPAWRVSLPQHIDYFERRAGYRLSVPTAMPAQVVVFESLDGPFRARLVDISRRGMATMLDPTVDAGIGILVPCTLRLLDDTVRVEGEIRSSVLAQNHLRVGVLFPNMSPSQRSLLDAAIARLERNLLRHYAATRPR